MVLKVVNVLFVLLEIVFAIYYLCNNFCYKINQFTEWKRYSRHSQNFLSDICLTPCMIYVYIFLGCAQTN